MGFVGLDAVSIQHLSRQLTKQSQEVSASASRIASLVEQVPWTGNDRDRFTHTWSVELSPRLRRASDLLKEAAGEAQRGADDQERISRA